jgi:hypothetical protein
MPSSTIAIFHLLDDLFRKFDTSQSTFFNLLGEVTRLSLSRLLTSPDGIIGSPGLSVKPILPTFSAWRAGTRVAGTSKPLIKRRLLPLQAWQLPGLIIHIEDKDDVFDGFCVP